MLADAGVATLDLQLRLLLSGCSLKDASAYNVQFVGGRPVFIDVSSIERPSRLDLWFALGQFGQMFTFPLLLACLRGWDLRSYFLPNLGGLPVERVLAMLGRLERWRPRYLLDVTLPAMLARRIEGKSGGPGRSLLTQEKPDPSAQAMNLRRLRRKIGRLSAGYRPQGVWSEYTGTCSYSDVAERAKRAAVRRFLERTRPSTVVDLGCNSGDYSFMAAELGARVVAVDGDHDAIECLYRRLRSHPLPVTPLVVDLSNPSPAIGFRNREREAFLHRVRGDCVLALALLHHLHVRGRSPALRGPRPVLRHDGGAPRARVRAPRTGIPMFERLLRFRVDLYRDYNLDTCRRVFEERFEVLETLPIADSPRTLLVLRKRASGSSETWRGLTGEATVARCQLLTTRGRRCRIPRPPAGEGHLRRLGCPGSGQNPVRIAHRVRIGLKNRLWAPGVKFGNFGSAPRDALVVDCRLTAYPWPVRGSGEGRGRPGRESAWPLRPPAHPRRARSRPSSELARTPDQSRGSA